MNEYLRNLVRIEFIVTMACTGKCKHCSEGNHDGFRGHINANAAMEAIKEICDLGIEEIERDRDKYQHPFEIQRGYITILGMIGRRLDGKKKPEDLDDDWG